MRQAVIRCGIVGMGFLLLTISSAKGIDTEATRATLQGLKGVHIVVEDLDPDVERDGLTQNQLRTDVELRLRKGGIRVLTREQRGTTPGHPYLYVHVRALRSQNSEVYAISISVELNQEVYLARDPNISVLAATWSHAESLDTGGTSSLRKVREHVADMVDGFINAYLAVNPEEAGRTLPPSRVSPRSNKR